MKRWLGFKNLVADAVIGVYQMVDDTSTRTVTTIADIARAAPVDPSIRDRVDRVEGVAKTGIAVHGAIFRGVVGALSAGIDTGHRVFAKQDGPAGDDAVPTPLRSDVVGSVPWIRDAALGAINGVAGDYLADTNNGLSLEMTVRRDGVRLDLDALAQPDFEPTGRICLFVHGLATTDWSWSWEAEKHHGDPTHTYGALLAREAGYTPVYLRYNSGKHVSENGRDLSKTLTDLIANWPVDVESLVVVGHSMGGLVSRSACHFAGVDGATWIDHLTHLYCIGSPHHGAALEKAGNALTSLLRVVPGPTARIIRDIGNRRSAGIKDLRFGYVRDEEWKGRDIDAFLENHRLDTPLPAHVETMFLSGAVGASEDRWLTRIIGDLLVRIPSAQGDLGATAHHIDAVTHVGLANHPQVYARIAEQLSKPD
jgi:triacylglycerol lipase